MANWMQNVVDNVRESQGKASDFLNGIIADKKTEYIDHRTAIVPGVYAGNSVYRKQALEHIWGVYNMLPDVLTQSMGKLFEIATESMLPPKNMKSLLDYTHDGASVYSTNIRSKYINLKDKKVENLSTVSKSSYMPWYFTDDDNLVGVNYAEYWKIGTPSKVFEHRRTAKEIERDARKAEKKAKKDARKQIREERQEKRINRIEEKNKERAERVEKRINKRKESKNKPNEPTNNLNFYDGSYRDMYYEDFLYETVETGNINEEGDFEVEEIPVGFVLRSRLLRKTTELFERGNIHYDEQIYGNLLEKTGGYVDSLGGGQDRGRGKSLKDRDGNFFRSWSHAKRYNLLGNSMRNGKTKSEIDTAINNKVKTQPNRNNSLNENTVLQSNGLIKISPIKEDNANGLYANLKKCMFSIENLALLDAHHVHYKEKDKNDVEHNYYRDMKAKRIMWFPPYDLKFSDNSNVQWNETNFIGRGEPIYTYANTKRSGTLSFTMLIDHPSIIHNFKGGHIDDSKLLKFFNGDVKSDDFEEKTFNVSADRYEVKEQNSGEGEPKETVNIDGPYSCFSVYFPYWYSGNYSDEAPDNDVMQWLYEGVGTKTINDDDAEFWGIIKQGYEMKKENGKTGISDIKSKLSEIEIESFTVLGTTEKEGQFNVAKGNWWLKEDDRLNRKFKIALKKGGVTKEIEIYAKYFHTYFNYNYLLHRGVSIDNEKGVVKINVTYHNKGTNHERTVALEKDVILNMYLKKEYSLIEKTLSADNYGKPDDIFKCANRLDKSGKEKNEDKGDTLNYTDSTERNSSCKDINPPSEEGVEKLSFENVYKLLEKGETDGVLKLKDAKNGDCEIEKIKIAGCYTAPNKETVSAIMKKRREVIRDWFKTKLNVGDDIFEVEDIYEGTEPTDIHGEDAVKKRRVDVYVVYKGNEIDKGVDVSKGKGTEEDENSSKKVTYGYSTVEEGFSVYNEAEYFFTLSETDNIAYNKIKDKIKNFNPAFHSITPEGFAMRLNFLHGCTRQGDTLEGSNSDKVATNLAFGRPPVCVLRIGDFINTKMIIRTLSINYETGSGIQWDLNPEGVGIQPMFAKVQMGIDLIGGQSLEGPVNQLNNALNGLHYANSGIINGKKKE